MVSKNEGKLDEPADAAAPQTDDEYVKSGWEHYSKKEYYRAEADFQKALELTPDNVDTMYALGMTFQASGRQAEAIRTFEKTIQLLENVEEVDFVRAHMMTRLARGHISRMKTGDWNLDATR